MGVSVKKISLIKLAKLLSRDESSFDIKVAITEYKGRGILATRHFTKGEFVTEYCGDLISLDDAKLRESKYSMNPTKGCFMFYFTYCDRTYCIDATGRKWSGRFGRLINHSRKDSNCEVKVVRLE